ncbi:MAG: glycosyltransferase family 1 protein [Candidatus Omnitrophica bacterium]|nr:glycosyltransferase family 1 protein [Candidatus Omnitrophota bacterium]
MRVGIDMQSTTGQRTGIGTYAASLAGELKKIDNGNQYFYYSSPRRKDLRTYERIYWENVTLLNRARRDKVDILHTVGFAPPVRKSCKLIATIHDLIGMIFPGNLGPVSRLYWSKWLPWASSKADRIIVSSENTKKDVIRLLKVKEDKVRVILLAVGDEFKPVTDKRLLGELAGKYNLENGFFLSVSTVEPRKNFSRLIEAFGLFKKNLKGPEKLVIVGMKGWDYPEIMDKIRNLGLENEVVFTGYVSGVELAALYGMAKIFVFPSLYEGFGLPVLEAMACGAPVVTSNTSSLPEVTGEAAMKVNPLSVDEIYGAIEKLWCNDSLRKELIDRASQKVKQFSWRKTAHEVVKVYEELCGK